MQLVTDAISAGVFNDLGSGSNVDLCVITADKVDYIRPQKQAAIKGNRYMLCCLLIRLAVNCDHVTGTVVYSGMMERFEKWCEFHVPRII